MTRFNAYILNEGRGKPISKEEAIELIKKNCSGIVKSYKTGDRIYRGAGGSDTEYQFIDPTKGKLRRSRNTRNYYTLLMDNLTPWKAYPKRSRSIVCSTDKYKAGGYGSLYIVLPYNNAKIGVCSNRDIWDSFKIVRNLASFNRIVQHLISTEGKSIKDLDKNWKTLLANFKDSEAYIQSGLYVQDKKYINIWQGNILYDDIYDKIVNGQSYRQVFNKLLDPKANGFKLKSPSNMVFPKEVEVWVGNAPSILIEEQIYEQSTPLQ